MVALRGGLFRRARPHQLTARLAQALAIDGLPPGMDPSTLAVVDENGSYSGRRVNYFRVFDPIRASERDIQVRIFTDLDTHPELVLGSGHLEKDGAVILSKRDRPTASPTFVRTQADRTAHGDDEQYVFHDRRS
jgi:hypothetical protein